MRALYKTYTKCTAAIVLSASLLGVGCATPDDGPVPPLEEGMPSPVSDELSATCSSPCGSPTYSQTCNVVVKYADSSCSSGYKYHVWGGKMWFYSTGRHQLFYTGSEYYTCSATTNSCLDTNCWC